MPLSGHDYASVTLPSCNDYASVTLPSCNDYASVTLPSCNDYVCIRVCAFMCLYVWQYMYMIEVCIKC